MRMGWVGAKLYGRMVKADEEALASLPDEVRQNVPGNGPLFGTDATVWLAALFVFPCRRLRQKNACEL